MNLIDKVILEWSYRTKKGYPDLNNEEDIRVFESLFGFNLKEIKKEFSYLSQDAQEIAKELMQKLDLSQDEIKAHSKNRIIVFTDRPRQEVFNSLADLGLEREPTLTGSSGGGFKAPNGVEIIHKAQTSVGDAGLDNENKVIESINSASKDIDNLQVVFSDGNKKLEYKGVKNAEDVGRDTGGNKKADILVNDNSGAHPISIKKDGSFRWSSAMKTHKDMFDKIMSDAANGKMANLKLAEDEDNPRLLLMINPENNKPYGRVFVVNAPGMDLETLAFGSDNAAIVQRTFSESDFNLEGNTLSIKATKILTDISDFNEDDMPVLQFERNASKATKFEGIYGRGITIRTVPMSVKNKETSRANNLTLDWNELK